MAIITGTSAGEPLVDFNTTNDLIQGNGGNDYIVFGDANDTVVAGDQSDTIVGGNGNDLILASGGNDFISTGNGNSFILAGDGNDLISVGSGVNSIATGDGNDTVAFQSSNVGTATISDFDVQHDTLDLRAVTGLTLDSLKFESFQGGTLITSNNGSMTGSIYLTGVDPSTLKPINLITQSACFLRGTLIATPEGERAVEALAIGDLVTTLDGVSRPVKWVGRRSFKRRFIGAGSEANPVVFKAGSLGGGLPTSDLSVSGKHAMYIGGCFVRAEDLVNGTTVTRDSTCELIEYFHVELETADVIFANGAPTESYANHNSRRMFTNWQDYVDLYGSEDALEPNADGEFDRPYPLITSPDVISALLAGSEADEPLRRAA